MNAPFSDDWPTISDFLADWISELRLPATEQATFDRYYHSYKRHFGPYIRRHYADQTREVMQLLDRGAGEEGPVRLLEIGAGCGTEALWFALAGASVISIDITVGRLAAARARQSVLERALGRKLDLVFEEANFLDLKLAGNIDIVWMEQTFHHLEPRRAVFGMIAKVLKAGGHVVISEANGWNPLLQAALFRKRGFRTRVRRKRADGGTFEYGNERITTPRALRRGLARAGIETVSTRYFRALPNAQWAERWAGIERWDSRFHETDDLHTLQSGWAQAYRQSDGR